MMFLILLLAGLNFKDWRKVLQFLIVLCVSYFVGVSLAIYSKLNFNLLAIRFVLLAVLFLLAAIKLVNFKKKYIKTKKKYLVFLFVILFSFFNGLGSSSNLFKELNPYYNEFIPTIEVSLGFSGAVFLIVLLLMVIHTIFKSFIKKKETQVKTIISIIVICISVSLIFKQILL